MDVVLRGVDSDGTSSLDIIELECTDTADGKIISPIAQPTSTTNGIPDVETGGVQENNKTPSSGSKIYIKQIGHLDRSTFDDIVSKYKDDRRHSSTKSEETKLFLGMSYWSIVKTVIWFVAVLITANHPVVQRLSYTVSSPEGAVVKGDKYLPFVVFTVMSFLASMVGGILDALYRLFKGEKYAFSFLSFMWYLPGGVFLAITDLGAVYAMKSVSPILFAIVGQSRLIITSAVVQILLKRRISVLEWMLCGTLTSSILAFVLLSQKFTDEGSSSSFSLIGLVLASQYVLGCVGFFVYMDWISKRTTANLFRRISYVRVWALITEIGFSIFFVISSVKNGVPLPRFGGIAEWDYKIWGMIAFFILRDYSHVFVLVYLGALWKAVAAALSISICYFEDTFILKTKPFNSIDALIIVSIVIDVACYALAKSTRVTHEALVLHHRQSNTNEK